MGQGPNNNKREWPCSITSKAASWFPGFDAYFEPFRQRSEYLGSYCQWWWSANGWLYHNCFNFWVTGWKPIAIIILKACYLATLYWWICKTIHSRERIELFPLEGLNRLIYCASSKLRSETFDCRQQNLITRSHCVLTFVDLETSYMWCTKFLFHAKSSTISATITLPSHDLFNDCYTCSRDRLGIISTVKPSSARLPSGYLGDAVSIIQADKADWRFSE